MPWMYSRRAARARFWAHVRLVIFIAFAMMAIETLSAGAVLAIFGPIAHDAWDRIAEALHND